MKKRNNGSPLSHIRLGRKFLLLNLAALLTLILTGAILTAALLRSEQKRRDTLEKLIVDAAERYVHETVENGVSIAKSAYTNEKLYKFLDTHYPSEAAYFDANYQMEQENMLELAGLQIVDNYTLYSANDTIMNGGHIRRMEQAETEGWYQTAQLKNKTLLLYCAPGSGRLSLVRRLDYYNMTEGDSFLKLDLNTAVIRRYCDALHFEGELDIVCDGILLYSSRSGQTMNSVQINEEFVGITQNYYTSDVEFYAKADGESVLRLLADHWLLLALFALAFIWMWLLMILLVRNLRQRTRAAEALYRSEGLLSKLRTEETGRDEIGELIRIGVSLSDKLVLRAAQLGNSQEQLAERQQAYRTLYSDAMRQDAALTMQRRYPALCPETMPQQHSLAVELSLIRVIAKTHYRSKLTLPDTVPEGFTVPVYALALTADDLLQAGGSLDISCSADTVTLHYYNSTPPPAAKSLKLKAIFEEDEICGAYTFRPQYAYQPYLYLKHSMGRRVSAVIADAEDFSVTLVLKQQEEHNDKT